MGRQDTDKVDVREAEGRGPIQDFLADAARAIASGSSAARCRCRSATA